LTLFVIARHEAIANFTESQYMALMYNSRLPRYRSQ